jgi:hypothetical protein
LKKPSALSPKNVAYAAERAAAYTVVVLHYGAVVQEVSTEDSEETEIWLPWALVCPCSTCSMNLADENWTDTAVFAAEIIAMRPEVTGEGKRWDQIDLHGFDVAEELIRGGLSKVDPRYLMSDWLSELMSETPTKDELKEARSKVVDLWQAAMALVKFYRPEITELTSMIKQRGYLNANEIKLWWKLARVKGILCET